ncbi:MAG: hypothetical protein OEV73_07740 [Desulfobulbaceae bacterium]|nr:hypothetical protein [Desulfobulbaceae bacterium]
MLFTAMAIQDYYDLFAAAANELTIFTGSHDQEYANEFITATGNFLCRPGSRLRLACQCNKPMQQCRIVQGILATPGRQGEILAYDSHATEEETFFTLADKAAYRIDFPEFAETITAYDDPEEAARLHTHFEYIISTATLTAHLPPPLKLVKQKNDNDSYRSV